jgi:phosphatidylglycerophosphate synthase
MLPDLQKPPAAAEPVPLSAAMAHKPWDARLAYRLVYPLRDTWVTPNHLTTLRLLFGLLAFAGLSLGGWWWSTAGALCFVVSNFLDHADGEFARITGDSSRFGHYYDLISDLLCTALLFVGIGTGLSAGELGRLADLMGVLAGVSVTATFHMRHVIEKEKGRAGTRQPHAGGFEAEDILYVVPLLAATGMLAPFLILSSIGAPLFAAWVLREFLALRSWQRP